MTQPAKVVPPPPAELTTIPMSDTGVVISSAAQWWSICQRIAGTEIVPPALRGKPEACFAVGLLGKSLGFDEMTSLRRIEFFSGKPTLPAELMVAVIQRQPDLLAFELGYEGTPYEDDFRAWIETERDGFPRARSEFSVADAKVARLWGKKTKSGEPTPWVTYPKAMLHARAVGVHARRFWADRMNGIQPSEDYERAERRAVSHARNVTPAQGVRLDLPAPVGLRELAPDPLLAQLALPGGMTIMDEATNVPAAVYDQAPVPILAEGSGGFAGMASTAPIEADIDGPEELPSEPAGEEPTDSQIPSASPEVTTPAAHRTPEFDARVGDLNAVCEQRAQRLHDELGLDFARALRNVRTACRKAVNLPMGQVPSLEQIELMIRAAPNATGGD